ncbi:MAG: outer membrane beta-barrel protein [Ectothiorhodospiraceae bacterium]|nr:outer membrane beta-barrel protein [Ectothiorhodospiraceae bacterium]
MRPRAEARSRPEETGRAGARVGRVRPAAAALVAGVWLSAAPAQEAPTAPVDLRMSSEVEPVQTLADDAPSLADSAPATRPTGIELRLSIGVEHSDNVRRARVGRRAGTALLVEPGVTASVAVGRHRLEAGYDGRWRDYPGGADTSRTEHRLHGEAALDIGRKLKARVRPSVELGHDPRGGLDTRIAQGDEPDRWRRRALLGEMVLGRRISIAQIIGTVELADLVFINNQQGLRDRDSLRLGLRGYWNVSPKLSWVADAGTTFIDFTDPAAIQDGTATQLQGGVRWEATAQTSGEVTVGLTSRRFDDPGIDDFDGLGWQASVVWEPRSYSKLRAYSARDTLESSDPASGALVNQRYGLRWTHAFSERWRLDTGAEVDLAEFGDTRDDRLWRFDAAIGWRLARWLEASVGYAFEKRDSDLAAAEYRENRLMLLLRARFEPVLGSAAAQ